MTGSRFLPTLTCVAALLFVFVPTAQAEVGVPRASCHQVFVGPDIDSGLCYDLDGEECTVWWYNTFGQDTCYVPALPDLVQGEHCHRLFYGPDIDQGICYDLSRDTCQVWYYSYYGTGPNYCIT